jgi:hypothetical protein
MMVRRTFLVTGAGLLAAPLAGEAQQAAGKVPRLGYLSALSGSDSQVQRNLEAFRQGAA